MPVLLTSASQRGCQEGEAKGRLTKINLKENTCINLRMGDIFYNSQKVEATQLSNHGWMEKQNVVCTYSGILFSLKKDGNSDMCYNMDESRGPYAQWYINQSPKDKCSMILFTSGILSSQAYRNNEVEWWLQGTRGGKNADLFGGYKIALEIWCTPVLRYLTLQEYTRNSG